MREGTHTKDKKEIHCGYLIFFSISCSKHFTIGRSMD